MKIISGIYKGRKIIGYDIDGTRPTMERVKESLFAMIQDKVKNSVVLDLFSGSGNLGIEALSQGAKFAYLSDKNFKACNVVKKNINSFNIKNAEVLNMDFKRVLQYLSEKQIKVDIIFLDPPYNTDYIEKSIELIDKYDVLNSDGLIICENDSLDRIIYSSKYTVRNQKKYGDKWVVILS